METKASLRLAQTRPHILSLPCKVRAHIENRGISLSVNPRKLVYPSPPHLSDTSLVVDSPSKELRIPCTVDVLTIVARS